MQIYKVGGAVRDRLLGRQVTEVDWLVVGATPEEMQASGFRPVGADFPVFLHPQTGEEYALARTERKSGRGYGGFTFHASPDVTLEEDLQRRDLTINAIAEDDQGQLIDPYGGQRDLRARLLRHVSPAFAEDPLRVLRVARFAARYAELGFRIAGETLELMRRLARSGELSALTAERSWKEISRALMEPRPEVFIQVLQDCDALAELFPELAATFAKGNAAGGHLLGTLRQCAEHAQPLPVRWACLLLGCTTSADSQQPRLAAIDTLNQRCKAPRIAKSWRCCSAGITMTRSTPRNCMPMHCSTCCSISTSTGGRSASSSSSRLVKCAPWQARPARCSSKPIICTARPARPVPCRSNRCWSKDSKVPSWAKRSVLRVSMP